VVKRLKDAKLQKIAKYLENIYYFGQSFVKVNGGRA